MGRQQGRAVRVSPRTAPDHLLCSLRMMSLFLGLLLIPFLWNTNAFGFVPSTKTLRGMAEESNAEQTDIAATTEAMLPSVSGPKAIDDLRPVDLDGIAASTTDGTSTPATLRLASTRVPRVYLGGTKLHVGKAVELTTDQTRYLMSVMRLRHGSPVRVFDGVNGEFLAAVSSSSARGGGNRPRRPGVGGETVELRVDSLIRQQPDSSNGAGGEGQGEATPVELIFAPIRKQRLKLMVEKAVELGVSRLTPVLTARTQKGSVSDPKALGKLGLGTAVEAAEQCERMTVPRVGETPSPLLSFLQDVELQRSSRLRGGGIDAEDEWDSEKRRLLPEAIFVCKERDTDAKPVLEALSEYARERQGEANSFGNGGHSGNTPPTAEAAFLVGPEGGFDPDEMKAMAAYPFVRFVSLGPLVLRAETAAVYALSSWSAFWAARRYWGNPVA